jgi:hypothetical protein
MSLRACQAKREKKQQKNPQKTQAGINMENMHIARESSKYILNLF